MEEVATYLPAEQKDLYTYRNKETGKLEQIDLRTGKMFEAYTPVKASDFCNMTADLICNDIREGKSLKETLSFYGVNNTVFYKWLAVFPEFKVRYNEARKQRADHHFYEVLDAAEIAKTAHKDMVPGLKLFIDSHKWAAEKSDPDAYNRKIDAPSVGGINITLNTGVLDSPAPKDIIIDEFGNFKGFDDGITIQMDNTERDISHGTSRDIGTDRWEVREESGREEGTEEREEV